MDAILALTVPTAVADLVPAACSAAISKPLVLSVLNQAEAVRLLPEGRRLQARRPPMPTPGARPARWRTPPATAPGGLASPASSPDSVTCGPLTRAR